MSEDKRALEVSETFAPGVRLCVEVRAWLARKTTAFQELELVDTPGLGRVLLLDGRFMLSERDEFFYHEMLVHPALLAHPQPERVLIVGGGDGGALREVLSHPTVSHAVLVEIDPDVLAVAQEHLPRIHRGAFTDPRAQVVVAPGEEYVAQKEAYFDVILVDSTDPIGPAAALFSPEFFQSCRRALRPGGLLALQAGSPFYYPDELVGVLCTLRPHFPVVFPYVGVVPLYPGGLWAYVLAGEGEFRHIPDLKRRFQERGLKTRYYHPGLHAAAFVLPQFVAELAEQAGIR